MFEQSVLTERRRPWTMAVSVTLQSAFVGAVLLVSMLQIERLPDFVLPSPMPPMPSAPRAPVQVIATEIIRSATTVVNRIFEPTSIPRSTAMIVDAPPGPPSVGSPDGVVGMPVGLGYSAASAVITASDVAPPPPPPQQAAPPDRKPEPPKMLQVGGNVLEGKLIRRVIPVYPVLAKQTRTQGVVELMGIVGRDGRIRDLKVISGHPLLIQSALDAVRQWLYSPTYLNGEPTEVMAPIQVTFTLTR